MDRKPAHAHLSPEVIEAFLERQSERGLGGASLDAYRRNLGKLYDYLPEDKCITPELTRREYLRLLQAAKSQGKERTYLLIKVLGGAGVRVQELPQLTVEAVREGKASFRYHNDRCNRVARLPKALREELLDFAAREGIREGPVFQSAGGGPLLRTYVNKLLQSVSPMAQVDGGKATPHCLWNMFQNTQETILNSIYILAEQAYDRMLEEEQRLAGWAE